MKIKQGKGEIMKIRLATKDDYKDIANLRWLHAKEDDAVYDEHNTININEKYFINEIMVFLNNNNEYKIFVAEENGKIVCSMFICIVPKVPSPNCKSKSIAYLTKVFTLEEYRNKNIGTEVLNYIKEFLIREKCELLFVWPSDNSIKYYEKNGFKSDNEIMECQLMDE